MTKWQLPEKKYYRKLYCFDHCIISKKVAGKFLVDRSSHFRGSSFSTSFVADYTKLRILTKTDQYQMVLYMYAKIDF